MLLEDIRIWILDPFPEQCVHVSLNSEVLDVFVHFCCWEDAFKMPSTTVLILSVHHHLNVFEGEVSKRTFLQIEYISSLDPTPPAIVQVVC